MRLTVVVICLAFVVTALSWTKDDYEIFDLVSALEAAEGKAINFYSHVGVSPSASTSEITKAYRKKSLELHPDKNPGVKNIHDRFARLGVIAQILRSPEGRERYDFFYKNGVPKWRGTGYYYSRFRPTLFHTLIFLVFLTSGFHYLVMRLNYSRDRRRVGYFDRTAKSAAGLSKDKGTEDGVENGKEKEKGREKKEGVASKERRRKVKVPMVEGSEFSGTLELIVEGDEVFLPHGDGSLTPLSGLAIPPNVTRTWPFLLIISLIARIISALPEFAQSSLPAYLRPAPPIDPAEDDVDDGREAEAQTARLRAAAMRNSRRLRNSTPKDSPATTELESDASEEEGEVENGDAGGEGRKKKRGPGKAAGLRRRKMALKR